VFCDGGLENSFAETLEAHEVVAEVVSKMHPGRFEVLPKRWIVERTWSWLMNNRRLQIDYERLPVVTEGFVHPAALPGPNPAQNTPSGCQSTPRRPGFGREITTVLVAAVAARCVMKSRPCIAHQGVS